MQYSMPRNRGFTLIELMVVVAIIAILTAIALPSYRDYVIRGNLIEATNQLAASRAQMEQYYQDARSYNTVTGFNWPCSAANIPTSTKWTYACSNMATNTYTITATANAGTPADGFAYSIDQANTQLTTAVIAGWGTAGTTHWIMSKGG
jgi:prepilin-type N-terminal cleavage/methylation domain-containing protein